MKTQYILEIYDPEDLSCVAGLYESNAPFGALNVGDEISGHSLNHSASIKNVKVTKIQHIFWEIENSHLTHKICVTTQLA
ncbi:TPA: hypothetical protein ACTW1K_002019 [Raoultella planticola]|nr:hypothetical protein [Klebsiella variicola]